MKNIHQYKNTSLVNKVFDGAFKKYDMMNDIMSLGTHRIWKQQFVDTVILENNNTIVDMASGTGDISRLLIQKNKSKEIIRIEPNFNMLNQNIDEFKNYKNIKHLCSYAETVPLKNNSIDAYLISFGLRNISKLDIALKEAFRILKKGGGFYCLEFYKVNKPILREIYNFYSKSIPALGKVFNQDSKPYEYLAKSIDDFSSQKEISKKLRDVGFKNISTRDIFGGIASIHYSWKLND
jgi:demethylmenaquinone methyltransferase/2-methoxy-6-polyprenyl-1,4-benzoquinol methylase